MNDKPEQFTWPMAAVWITILITTLFFVAGTHLLVALSACR